MGAFLRRVLALFRSNRLERDLEDELAFHMTMRQREQDAANTSPDKAQRLVHRRFGSLTFTKERAREAWTFVWLDTFLQDCRFGIRSTEGTPYGTRFQIAGDAPLPLPNRPGAGFKVVSPSYMEAVGLRLIAGRPLKDDDREGTPFAVVINETFARTYFPGEDPIGRQLLMSRTLIQAGTTGLGLRMALGAQSKDVVSMVVGEGLRLALAGLTIGVAVAYMLRPVIVSMLYGVGPTDPTTL